MVLVTNINESYLVLILAFFQLFLLFFAYFGLFGLFSTNFGFLEIMVLIFTVVLISTQKLTQNKNHQFFESAWFLVFFKFESLFVKIHGSYKKCV